MKQKVIYRSRIIAILFLISHLGIVNAQGDNFVASSTNGYYFNPQNIGLSTPQATDFVTYGNLNVNHYNGLLNMSIELDGYKDCDFDLPISIKYVSSGFAPFKRPSVVGYNWFLNFGGAITRTIKGSPDETKGNYENNSAKYLKDGLLVAIRNNTFSNYNEQALVNFQMPRNSNSSVPYLWGDFKYDFEPDIFNFSFGPHSGSFIIGNDGNPVCLSGNGYKIDISGLTIQEYSTTAVPQSSTIKITTPDGFVYEFGGNTDYLEYSIPNNPDKVVQKPRCILSWYLKSIKAPNNRVVEFAYESKLLPNSYTYLLHLDFQMGIYFVNPSIPPSQTAKEISEQTTMRDDVYSPILKKVVIDDTEIRFQTITGPSFHGNSPSIYFSNISIYNGTIKDRETKFTYLTQGRYNFLSQLNRNDQVYSFNYNLPASLPSPLTTSLDHWGFWNGGTEATISDIKGYCLNVEANKNTLGQYFNVGLLSKITYPTRGYSEITYEQNRYDRYMERNLQQERMDLLSTATSTLCGGARVKQIKDYDVVTYRTANLRTFQYIVPQTGRGSGIIGNKPKYKVTDLTEAYVVGSNPYTQITYVETISTNSLGYNENLPEHHIGYSDVTEHFSDGSYIHYQYTSHVDNPNTMEGTTYSILMSSARELEIREKHGMYISNDLSHFRGKLSEKKIYDTSGIIKQTERYTYNTGNARSSYNTSVASTPRGPASYRIYLTPCLLKKKEVTDSNGIQYTEDYQYNDKSIISERKTTNSNGDEMAVQYSYPSDYAYSTLTAAEKKLMDCNMLDSPLRLTKTVRKGSTTAQTLDVFSFEYKIENNQPLLYRLKRQDGNNVFRTIEEYRKYDVYGNPVSVVKDNLVEFVYLWSYKGKYVIAEIKNSSYEIVAAQLSSQGVNIDEISVRPTPSFAWAQLEALRTLIPSAHITRYYYNLLHRIEQITDPKGAKTYYEYDNFGRLKESYLLEGNKKKILEAYEYNYAQY